METINLKQKLVKIQNELKVNKSHYNNFGKYNYRNAEDILEAIKPLCMKYNCLCFLENTIEIIGDRTYIKSKCLLHDLESEMAITTFAYAREPETIKGMSEMQITGATISYSNKYCLGNMFMLDDSKDADHPIEPEKKIDMPVEKEKIDLNILFEQCQKRENELDLQQYYKYVIGHYDIKKDDPGMLEVFSNRKEEIKNGVA